MIPIRIESPENGKHLSISFLAISVCFGCVLSISVIAFERWIISPLRIPSKSWSISKLIFRLRFLSLGFIDLSRGVLDSKAMGLVPF